MRCDGKWFVSAVLVLLAAGPVLAQDAKMKEAILKRYSEWVGNPANTTEVASKLPKGVTLAQGRLEFSDQGNLVWRGELSPNATLTPEQLDQAKATIREFVQEFLKRDGQQAFAGLDPAQQQALLDQLTNGVVVDLVKPKEEKKPVEPVQPPAPAATAPLGYRVDYLYNRGYESYWAGQYDQARTIFRAITAGRPNDAEAWYFQALCDLAMGDQAAAQGALTYGVGAETRSRSSRAVSFALIRVQGQVRNWIEQARNQTVATTNP